MEFITPITVALFVIIAPTVATYRSWNASWLSALVSTIYALAGVLTISIHSFSLKEMQEGSAPNINYEIVSSFYLYLNTALYFAFIAIILLIRDRHRSTAVVKLLKVLFWLINLGVIARILSVKVHFSLSTPRRNVDYEGTFHIIQLIAKWASYTSGVSAFSLFLIVILSSFFGRKNSLQAE